jgi:hypothetical protein
MKKHRTSEPEDDQGKTSKTKTTTTEFGLRQKLFRGVVLLWSLTFETRPTATVSIGTTEATVPIACEMR